MVVASARLMGPGGTNGWLLGSLICKSLLCLRFVLCEPACNIQLCAWLRSNLLEHDHSVSAFSRLYCVSYLHFRKVNDRKGMISASGQNPGHAMWRDNYIQWEAANSDFRSWLRSRKIKFLKETLFRCLVRLVLEIKESYVELAAIGRERKAARRLIERNGLQNLGSHGIDIQQVFSLLIRGEDIFPILRSNDIFRIPWCRDLFN